MILDPFYRDIINGLNHKLDPELFEQCAADLLRRVYPGLVPIRGGNDAGMDGAISDTEGVAFPLVTTTQEDVIGNLTKSLESYLIDGGPRRKVVLATSQNLTRKRRSNLEQRASKYGFTLIQVHQREAIADLLYKSPSWCKELLGLTGQPPALSALPVASRPQIVQTLIGREDDLAWLKSKEGDLLLVGQPGSGKTFLMYTFVRQGCGLFVVSDSPAEIAASVREQSPEAIIVDDAHVRANLLNELRHLRDQMGAEYRIIATCWPGQKDTVLQFLQLATSSIHELDLLTRDQIVELVKSAGIAGPTELIRELVNQAEGRPGRAATLCHLCIRGDVREVALGEALSTDIRTTFEPLLGTEATVILAALSLGGDSGMPMDAVATHLGIGLAKVREVVTGLAAGGMLTDVGQDRLSVGPPTLRYALVRDVFFRGATSMPHEELIKRSSDAVETTLTLIGAGARGAQVPPDMLIRMVSQVNTDRVWREYSHLGPNECGWVLADHPDKLPMVAEAALHLVPKKAIPLLLSQAIGDTRPLHSHPDHSLRQIEDWVKSAEPGSSQVIARREALLDSTVSWFAKSPDAHTALQAISLVLSPVFADSEMSPGSGLVVSLRSGLVTQNQMSSIRGFWPRVMEFLKTAPIERWGPMFDLMHRWLHPRLATDGANDETRKAMLEFAAQMATDITGMNADRPGVLSHISRVFKKIGLRLPIELNPEFDTLYPEEEWGLDRKEIQARQAVPAEELAKSWSTQDAKDIAGRMVQYESEARNAQLTWPCWSTFVAERIAAEVNNPSTWARAFIQTGADSKLVTPFLQIAALKNDPEYPELLKMCLQEQRLHFAGVSVGLTATFLPGDLLLAIMSVIDNRFSNWVEVACMRLEIHKDRVAALLSHSDCSVVAAAAIGEWLATTKGTVRESLRALWRTAIINCLEDDYEGEEIFRQDPTIAFEWLRLRIKDTREFSYRGDHLLDSATGIIGIDHRKLLIQQIGDDFWREDVIQRIVDDQLEVYKALLQSQQLKRFHLSPLVGNPTGVWIDKALAALDAGYSAQDVALAVFGTIQEWSGNESGYWAKWAACFGALLMHDDCRIRKVGAIGNERALAQRNRALSEERREAIYGR